ncbi:MAG: flagellar protein FlaG [Clostridia bacterium]|nr:flagellar protein FlaG [Clostridia bacterium]
MRLNGVDPRVIEYIQNQTIQPVVRETKRIRPVREYKEQEGREDQGRQEYTREGLKHSLDKLNGLFDSFENPVGFRLVEEDEKARVAVVDLVEDRVIKNVEPEKVMSMMMQMEKLLGFLVDVLI